MRDFWLYLAVCAGVTYLIRMLPLVLVKRKIQNRFIRSFLYYVPYAVLTVMTLPGIFSSTAGVLSASVGFGAALIAAYHKKSLLTVAALSCAAVFITERILDII